MYKLGLICCAVLCTSIVVRSQASIPSPSPSVCATQSFAFEGRALRNEEPVGNAEVVVINKNTKQEKTTNTNNLGRFTITALSCGSYDISIKKPGFTTVTMSVELQTTLPLTFKMEDSGIDPPESAGGSGEVPVGDAAPSEGVSRARTGAQVRGRRPEMTSPINSSVTEPSTQVFTGDIDCRTWLDSQKAQRKRLARIIPVKDGKSIFILEPIKESISFNYTVLPIGESPDENGLLNRIRLNSDKTFLGIHRLGPTSYLMVFYGR